MTTTPPEYFVSSSFQLTSSQGGWPCSMRVNVMFFRFSTHILTRRMTVLTTKRCYCLWLFNSHPHKEDDPQCAKCMWVYIFSTHILTRRMTVQLHFLLPHLRFFNSHPHKEDDPQCAKCMWVYIFSTHILTRRMTKSWSCRTGCSDFQLTSSQGGWLFEWNSYFITLFFQLTSSQGGWLFPDTTSPTIWFFQLTSSQGGWHQHCLYMGRVNIFNSHPHKEDDRHTRKCRYRDIFSTHILTRRMT